MARWLGLTFAALALFAACDQFTLTDAINGESGLSLTVAPGAVGVTVSTNIDFAVVGGKPPYAFDVAIGGGSIIDTIGTGFTYRAPSISGTAKVRVTDSFDNRAEANISVWPSGAPLAISPSAITLSTDDQVTFAVTGGTAPFAFTVVTGSGSIGASTGTFRPSATGTEIVRASDADGEVSYAEVTVTASGAGLAISPSAIDLNVNGSATFTASGGEGPYEFSMFSGSGSVDQATGAYSAPNLPGTDVVRLTDNTGTTRDATVTVTAPPLLISPSMISVYTNTPITFTASGGVPPYTFTALSGTIPDDSVGEYVAPGIAISDTVRVTDYVGAYSDATVTVSDPPAPLSISPDTVSVAANGSVNFNSTGGDGDYTYSITDGGGTIDSASGIYTAPATAGSATVLVTDGALATSEATVTITGAAPLVISPSSVTINAGGTIQFSAGGGNGPYTYSRFSGSGSVDPGTGLYTAAMPDTDIIRVTDNDGATSDATVTVVSSGPLSITPASLTMAIDDVFNFAADGGTPPYTFSVYAGSGSVNAGSGQFLAPSMPGSATVRVTDDLGATSDAAVTIDGVGCGKSFTETDNNNDTKPPWNAVDDFGIVLAPGCEVTIIGVTDADDTFVFDTGSAQSITFVATWMTGSNSADFGLQDENGDLLFYSFSFSGDVEMQIWTVDVGMAQRYLTVEKRGAEGVAYTLTIDAE